MPAAATTAEPGRDAAAAAGAEALLDALLRSYAELDVAARHLVSRPANRRVLADYRGQPLLLSPDERAEIEDAWIRACGAAAARQSAALERAAARSDAIVAMASAQAVIAAAVDLASVVGPLGAFGGERDVAAWHSVLLASGLVQCPQCLRWNPPGQACASCTRPTPAPRTG